MLHDDFFFFFKLIVKFCMQDLNLTLLLFLCGIATFI